MTNDTYNKIIKQINSLTNEEYNELLEQSKEMNQDYLYQLENMRLASWWSRYCETCKSRGKLPPYCDRCKNHELVPYGWNYDDTLESCASANERETKT